LPYIFFGAFFTSKKITVMIILGLGTNLKNRLENIELAITLLSEIFDIVEFSQVYESKAMLKNNAPSSWDKNFLNMVVAVDNIYNFTPMDALKHIKNIEIKMGRLDDSVNNISNWSPRIIDIDIILWDNLVLREESDSLKLQIPHPEMHKRNFVLLPLLDIYPEWKHPDKASPAYNQTLRDLLKPLGVKGISVFQV